MICPHGLASKKDYHSVGYTHGSPGPGEPRRVSNSNGRARTVLGLSQMTERPRDRGYAVRDKMDAGVGWDRMTQSGAIVVYRQLPCPVSTRSSVRAQRRIR